MKKKIVLSADGESLCKLARTWYWNNENTYEEVEKFLLTFCAMMTYLWKRKGNLQRKFGFQERKGWYFCILL